MKALKNAKTLVLGASAILALSACGGPIANGQRHKNEEIFDNILGNYQKLHDAAAEIANDSERYVKYAEAEAELLDAAIMAPYSTQGGTYTISRVAPRTIPYVLYGNDEDRLKNMIAISDSGKFIKKEERAELLKQWQDAREGKGTYDPKAYLAGKGYNIATDYTTTFSTAPETMDLLNTSQQSDSEILVNMIESLVEYDNLGVLHGRLAKEFDGVPYKLSEDGKTYTFELIEGAAWYDNEGNKYADMSGDDFVAGFQHMLDCGAGLEFLFEDVVEGVSEYLYEGGSFDKVGVKAEGNKVSFTLCKPENFFVTRLAYSCSSPICRKFFEAKGGKFGVEEYKAASAEASYTYGKAGSMSDMVYNSAYLPKQWDVTETTGTIKLEKNAKYYDAAKVSMNSLTWIYNNGENMEQLYKDVKDAKYAGLGLSASTGTLKWAKDDGFFDASAYISDTNATSYMMALNANRGTWSLDNGGVPSPQSEEDATAIWNAMQNKDFRKAILHGIDRKAWNAITRGEDLAATNIRNIYTAPEFVSLKEEQKVGNKVFPQGTPYGDLVQYFLDAKGVKVKAADGQDGWYNPEYAQECLKKAKLELGNKWPSKGVNLDVVYYGASASQVANANGFKELVEKTLGELGVHINLIEATTSSDFYAVGYRASSGDKIGQDIFYGSGWGPDYADPSTYLDTFAEGGYMVRICGLNM